MYQEIEAYLKLLLPHMRRATQSAPSSQPLNWRELIDSKVTLGALVKQFSEKADAMDPDGFSRYLDLLVQQRNDLVHHLLVDSERPLTSDGEVESRTEMVRQLVRNAAPFRNALRLATGAFKTALDDPTYSSSYVATFELQIAHV
jgi:hypothetical protein